MAVGDYLAHLKLDTERIPDKVVWRSAPTYSVPLAPGISAYTEYTIAHGLPFVPLIIGSYSDDSFVTSYDFGVGPYGTLTTYAFDGSVLLAHAYSDATNVTIRVISHNTARTITFHLVGLYPGVYTQPDAYTLSTPPVQDDFLLSTDLNSLKHIQLYNQAMTTTGVGTWVYSYNTTGLSTTTTPMCFVTQAGKTSFMNTMNTITGSGVNFGFLTTPGNLTLAVEGPVATVNILVKAYADA